MPVRLWISRLEILPDGTIVAITYVKCGRALNNTPLSAVRFKLEETVKCYIFFIPNFNP